MTGPETLTVLESNLLLDQLIKHNRTKPQYRRSIRNHLMGLLMLDAGLRVSEVVGLLIADLCLNGEARYSLLVREEISKNKSSRLVPLNTRIQADIAISYKHCWPHFHLNTNLPAFRSRTVFKGLTSRQVERIIGQAAEMAIGRWIHPHILRHTFASRLMRTCNARIVQELLGHKHLSSTQIYTHPNEDDKRKAIESVEKGEQ